MWLILKIQHQQANLFCFQRLQLLKIKERNTDVFRAIGFEFLNPSFELLEGLSFSDIVDNNGNPTVFVVDFRNCFVLLLTCGVPNLELYFFFIEGMNFLEVYSSKGRLKELVEVIVNIANGQTGFPYSNPSNYYDFSYSSCFLHQDYC